MDILDYIPQGRDNAVTRRQLKDQLGISDRKIRQMISMARRKHCILNDQSGDGYYTPCDSDAPAVREWLAQETHRAKSIFWSARGARDFCGGERQWRITKNITT